MALQIKISHWDIRRALVALRKSELREVFWGWQMISPEIKSSMGERSVKEMKCFIEEVPRNRTLCPIEYFYNAIEYFDLLCFAWAFCGWISEGCWRRMESVESTTIARALAGIIIRENFWKNGRASALNGVIGQLRQPQMRKWCWNWKCKHICSSGIFLSWFVCLFLWRSLNIFHLHLDDARWELQERPEEISANAVGNLLRSWVRWF